MGADCCGGKKPLPPTEEAQDSCCDDSSVSDCNKSIACCSPGNEKCNEECLLSVAATLCAEEVGHHTTGHNACCGTGCSEKQQKSACDAHLQMAFDRYQSFLDDVRCICRNMIERGYKSCCKPSEGETNPKTKAKVYPSQGSCKVTEEDCCRPAPPLAAEPAIAAKAGCCSADGRKGQRQCCGSTQEPAAASSDREQSDDCCSGKKRTNDCCSSKKTTPGNAVINQGPRNCCSTEQKPDDSCANKRGTGDSCCGNKTLSCSINTSPPMACRDECCGGTGTPSPDPCCAIEKQDPGADPRMGEKDQVIDIESANGQAVRIGVSGMTCNGCSENLSRNLAANGGRNIRVNYLQGHADFTIENGLSVETLIAKTREATGFQITIMGGDESITVLAPTSAASTALGQVDLEGIKKVVVLNKRTVRIDYDPTIIGARDLFREIGHLQVALAPPQKDQQFASGRKRFIKLLVQTTASFVFTIPVLVLAWGETRVEENTKAIVSLVLGSLVQLLAVPAFYKPALKSLILSGTLELDMLVVVAITAAYAYSIVAFGYLISGRPLETASFFETSSLLISLIMLGRLVASYARIRAVASVSVRSLQASTATLLENGLEREIDSRLLQFGDIFKVTPHSRVPTDGIVISGVSDVDESMVTGESLPITKGPGADLIAGTTNGSGTLVVQLTRLPGKNTITDIAQLVEDASSSRPRVQEIADRVASWFLPTVLTIAVAVFIIWTIVGIKVRNQTGGEAVATAITYAVAVLAVSCPCGLGLAVPMVLVIANGIAARHGVIIKSAQCTERARGITDVVFDKTGTLTEATLDVVAEEYFGHETTKAHAITQALIGDSQHPISVAVAKHLGPDTQPSSLVTGVQSIPGAGIEGYISGVVARAGNANWTCSDDLPEVRRMQDAGMSILVVTQGSTPIAGYGLRTRLRSDAAATVAKLREDGINVHLVSGDQNKAVQAIAAAVGIDRMNVVSQQNPQQKQDYVAALMARPGKVVVFCGDGTNDAVAVARADIGVQLSDTISSEVTRSAADVVLLSGLSGIPFLIEVSRAAFVRTTFNFVWSAIYNVFAILLAAGAFVRIRIAPAYAGAGELVSILPIIIAALTMLLLNLRPN
ncbi:E1-E2 ATPase-domain-containing protein [Xylaria bambusicola]|uniref:E1-E2 ATPase-domain-containing protein n=1 Tax=Xylaria bambusicola TaxID=326684 RepID=UPI002008AE46|nr:E1-E2 ATPase-domain-containing protein [Xylaria bambusicola]KAI0526411.1 E1-E2 ATPase-domain-containing protein [Xylaria bambusicola]